jgi:hypothetical protein
VALLPRCYSRRGIWLTPYEEWLEVLPSFSGPGSASTHPSSLGALKAGHEIQFNGHHDPEVETLDRGV